MAVENRGEAGPRTSNLAVWSLRVVALIALLPLGSTGSFAMPFATLIVALWCGFAFLLPGRFGWVSAAGLTVAAFLAIYVFLQVFPELSPFPPSPVWGAASELLGVSLNGSTSIAPGLSLAALPVILSPFLVFSASLHVLDSDEASLRMLRFCGLVGALVAFFGIAQFALFPDTLLIFEKKAYLDSLTAIFVNRNSAATFLGCTFLVLIGFAISLLKGRPVFKTLAALPLKSRKSAEDWSLAILVLAASVTIFALFLTTSRAGIGSTLAAFCFLILLMNGLAPLRGPATWGQRLRRASLALALAAIGCLFALLLLGGQTLRRAELRGLDDARFCFLPGIWRAAVEAWPFGTGAGTFELAFLPFRDPACGIYGAFDKAHNFYLEGLVTLGIGFVAAAAVVYAILVTVLLRGLVRRRRFAFVPAIGLSLLLLLTMHDLVDFSLQIPGIAIWVAILMAATCGTAMRRTKSRSGSGKHLDPVSGDARPKALNVA
ncbi:O-antigen ligase family protein [Aureimonas psammosilenae]|uniref:O-antigen ligase family protein n=1 Tax=Aureimonas psammosilenae TaxID=2495496 RepID=UPI001260ECA3|nr:O-antigen ligase family protein [Aureimonas psammosilenae]